MAAGTLASFEPVLIKEGSERRMAKLDLPQDPEERGQRLLTVARGAEEAGRFIGLRAQMRVGAGAEAEINETTPRLRA